MAEVIPIEDDRAKKILSYPFMVEEFYRKVLMDLRQMGVGGIFSEGKVEINRFRVLGKGCVGVVALGLLKGEMVALKILRVDADRGSLRKEGEVLMFVNRVGIGPRLSVVGGTAIAMEYIRGKTLLSWLREQNDSEKVRSIVRELLGQCRTLDEIGVDHGELSDAKKHVIVDQREKPRIIDFETASRERKCRNLVSMAGYLFFKKTVSDCLMAHLSWDNNRLKKLLRDYKSLQSLEVYERVVKELGL